MPVLNADALLDGIPFLSKRSRGSLPSIRTTEWTKHSISFAAKVAVCALICTNLVHPAQATALSVSSCAPDHYTLACDCWSHIGKRSIHDKVSAINYVLGLVQAVSPWIFEIVQV